MKTLLITSESRGHVKHDWLESFHTFSFADYHDANRMNFGLMRVLNDDIVQPAKGFDPHSHQNMEIITIPLSGMLAHQDHLGNKSTIEPGEVQIMSAGTGIIHSEYNASKTENVNLFQIWIFPKEKQILPRYGQKKFPIDQRKNAFQCVVSPDEREGSLWINQDAFIHLANLEKGTKKQFTLQNPDHGAFVMIVQGNAKVAGTVLKNRDAIGISETGSFDIETQESTDLVVFEIPMN